METFVSAWANGKNLPPKYVFPPGKRPGNYCVVPTSKSTPVIDLANMKNLDDRTKIIQQILEAAQNYGVFQVINHGVPLSLINDTRVVVKEFLDLPSEEKARFYTRDLNKKFMLFTSSLSYDKEAFHYWRDVIKHFCTSPMEDSLQQWPSKPLRYRDVVGNYIANQRLLASRIFNMISEGLGLEQGYFDKGLCEEGNLSVNHYPACSDPTLTWGAGEHNDPGLMTILHQDEVEGLQILNNDGNWTLIEPNPNAFVVIVGTLLQVVSNGKLKSAKHRVVTNATKDRTTLGFFNEPRKDRTVGPAKALLSSGNPPICEPVQFGDLLKAVVAAFTGVKE